MGGLLPSPEFKTHQQIVNFFKNNVRVNLDRNSGYIEVSLQIKPDYSEDKWITISMDDIYVGDK